jgi:hypothetical protein
MQSINTLFVPSNTRHKPAICPTTIAVHDDSNMAWDVAICCHLRKNDY